MKLRFELMNDALLMIMPCLLEHMCSSSDCVSLALNPNPNNILEKGETKTA